MAKSEMQGPNTKLAMIAIVLILVGVGWSIYTANPGGMLRAKTADEIKADKEAKKEAEHKKREEERKRRRPGAPAH